MSTEWYYTSAGQELGPVTSADIRQLAADGVLGPEDQVWNKSLTEWISARRVKGLTFGGTQHHEAAQEQPAVVPAAPVPEVKQFPAAPIIPSQMLGYESPGGESSPVTGRTVELLKQTRPWVLVMTILMFIGAGLMVLAAIGMIFFAAMGRGAPAGFGAGLALAYIAMAAFMAGPPIFLAKYVARIGNLTRLRRAVDLEYALAAQKSYWKFVALASLIFIGLYIAVIAFVIIARL